MHIAATSSMSELGHPRKRPFPLGPDILILSLKCYHNGTTGNLPLGQLGEAAPCFEGLGCVACDILPCDCLGLRRLPAGRCYSGVLAGSAVAGSSVYHSNLSGHRMSGVDSSNPFLFF